MRCFPVAVLLGAAGLPAAAGAQGYPFSQRGSVSQMVAFTELRVDYGRPLTRGRILFGDSGVVKWNAVWNPGADSATRLAVTHDILVEGQLLRAGAYSVWIVPASDGPWTLIFSAASHVFHTPYPGETHDALRLRITPARGSHMETLAFYFPVVRRDEATMRIHWGETMLAIGIKAPHRPPEFREP